MISGRVYPQPKQPNNRIKRVGVVSMTRLTVSDKSNELTRVGHVSCTGPGLTRVQNEHDSRLSVSMLLSRHVTGNTKFRFYGFRLLRFQEKTKN